MQVTQVADNVTHAVIGNAKARDFGISNSAEFFNILSNTLYSDKILAVVREVLCNAWDIHIQTGRTDQAVAVTLEDGKLTIRDFGTGISDDDIHPIYAVYGNSTKKLDGNQTGGFGLGSKAPFAYVDHFEVTSYHNPGTGGRKTIYAVSKSSAEVAGKPSIMPLVSVPCGDETGLSVSMTVKTEDRMRFKQVVEMIAMFGEMNVTFNGSKLRTIPFSQGKHGFLMLKEIGNLSGSVNQQIFVRYGNVVYPVPEHEKFASSYKSVLKLLERTSGGRHSYYGTGGTWKIIFQASPDTISVTPSRESLSMTDHTTASILALLTDFLSLSEAQLQEACVQIEREWIATVWRDGRASDLLSLDRKVPTLFDRDSSYEKNIVVEPKFVSDIPTLGRAYMSKSYPDFDEFQKLDVDMRLEVLEKSGFGGLRNRGKIQSFRREHALDKDDGSSGSAWFQRVIVQPLTRKLDAVPELSASKLLVYGDHADKTEDKHGRRRSWSESKRFVEAGKLSPRQLKGYLPFLRNFVVISFNRIDVEERLPRFPMMKETLGRGEDMFVYVVSRADKKIEIVRQFFADQGMTVVDLTVRQDWEPKHAVEPVPRPAVAKPRKKGLPKLSGILFGAGTKEPKLDHRRFLPNENGVLDAIERTESPQYVVKINPRANSQTVLEGLDVDTQRAVVELYGDLGGVVVNDNQYQRFTQELKIPAIKLWLLAKLKEEVLTNPRLQLHFSYNDEKIPQLTHKDGGRRFFERIMASPDLALEFGVLNETTAQDRKILSVIRRITDGRYYSRGWSYEAEIKEMLAHINVVQTPPEVMDLADKIATSKLVGLLNVELFSEIFGETPTERQKKQKSGALDILLYALA